MAWGWGTGRGAESSGSTLHPSPVPGVDTHSHISTFCPLSLALPHLLAINPLPAVGGLGHVRALAMPRGHSYNSGCNYCPAVSTRPFPWISR